MDADLKSQIAQALPPEASRQLATTVGMDDGQAANFIAAAIPALLAALVGALPGQGAKALSDAVSNSDSNALDRLRHALAASDLQPLNEGANLLTPVLGQGLRDRLANALADYIGAPVEATLPALGAVAQATIATLGQQDPSLWSDEGAIRNYLSGQRSEILAAVPAALAAAVGAVAPKAAPQTAWPRAVPPPPAPPPPASGGYPTWLIVVIVIVILALGGYYFWAKTHPKPEASFNAPTSEFAFGAAQDHRN